jgi:hypothetical protein
VPSFRTAEVTEVLAERPGLQRVRVRMPDGSDARAYSVTQLTGTCAVGDRIVVNTTAVELGLGTGGWHVVHWNLARDELVEPGPEHIMKLRYTSLQFDAGTDELDHPEVDRPLDGLPVAVCSVHSQVATVAAAFATALPGRRLVYVMTDGASLPIAMSDLVVALRDKDLVQGTVTAGHAFGGDLEAVTVASALGLAAHVLDADAVVVGMGPGVVGTGTRLGTTGIEVAPILDTVAALGGTPVLCVRASDGDHRHRHRGVSHHTRTVLSLTGTEPLVAHEPDEVTDLDGIRVVEVDGGPTAAELFARLDLHVTTMGRTVDEDPLFFAAAAAAGRLLAQLTGARGSGPHGPTS